MITTGIAELDYILGGGLPEGRLVEIYGHSGSCKTSLAFDIAANVGGVVYIDTEHSFRPSYAKQRGLEPDNLLVHQPNPNEDVFSLLEDIITTNKIKLIIIDTMAGLDYDYIQKNIVHFIDVIARNKTCVLYLNQIREKIGSSTQVSAIGLDLKFFVDIRMCLSKIKTLKKGTKNIGKLIKVKTVKNRLTRPFQEIELKVMYNEDISN